MAGGLSRDVPPRPGETRLHCQQGRSGHVWLRRSRHLRRRQDRRPRTGSQEGADLLLARAGRWMGSAAMGGLHTGRTDRRSDGECLGRSCLESKTPAKQRRSRMTRREFIELLASLAVAVAARARQSLAPAMEPFNTSLEVSQPEILDSREGASMASSWTEYLTLTKVGNH